MFRFAKVINHILAFTICLSTLILSGCWDRIETNELAIVAATGLDITDDDQVELSIQIVNPKGLNSDQQQGGGGGQGGGKPFTVQSATGKTLFDARSKIQEKFSRELFWEQNQVVVIGEKMARTGIQNHIDFFARHPFPRLRAFTFVTIKEKPVDILKVLPELESSSAEAARKLTEQKVGMSITLKDLLQMLEGQARSAALPLLETVKNPRGITALRMNGTAIFKRGKMVGNIGDEVTRGVLWLRNENETPSVTIQPKHTKGHISFHLLNSRTQLIPQIKDDTWKMTVNIWTLDDPVDNETKLDLMDPKIIKELQADMEERIKERIRITLEQVQTDMNADIFGFAEAFHRHYPKQWSMVKDHWDEKFPEIEVEINCKVNINRPGRSTSPQGTPDDEVIK